MIRISSHQVFSGGINRLQELNVDINKTSEQISTGKRVNRPSDDPVAAARILKLNQEMGRIDQYQRNADLANNRLSQEEGALGSMVDVVQRVRELTVQAGNGSLSPDDRKAIAAELKERLGQLSALANTRDASGEYIFSGFQGNTPAFGQNISGDWVYQGDEGQRMLEIDDGVKVAISDNGKDVFVNVPAANPDFFAEAGASNQSGARISTGMVLDQALFNAVYPDDIVITINAGADAFSAALRSDPATPIAGGAYQSGEPIRVAGTQVEITGAAAGDTFTLKTSDKQSIFTSIEKLIYGLENQAKAPAVATVSDASFVPAANDKLVVNGEELSFGGGETLTDLRDMINGNAELNKQGVTATISGGNLRIESVGQDLDIRAAGNNPATDPWAGNLKITGAKFDDIDITTGAGNASASFASGQRAYDDLIANSLTNLDNAQESIVGTQTKIGGRMNNIETTQKFLEDSALYTKEIRSQLQDLDYAEAISTLSFQSFVLEAAQLSFAQVSRLSLFDRL
ncbi:flagellar hook-associated protein FlgL [Marinobacter sp. X15-166B]|uniref:flagellar hook-associated protein FlgL n=1 Tax=Marinobacter sp. X15-166B TaxID=1897620 RepID=UPI00085BC18F|nr:flagellar hook-associated protein FlgL [Marinobacter sp. X15-166B]OEY67365.1 flagellar hook-associated protein 3 [Marinobacter sp. X15-166B]